MIADYLELEGLIKQRLSSTLGGIRVFSAADLDGVQEAAQAVPAVHVVLTDDTADESKGLGRAQRITQSWSVVCVTRNVRDATGEAGRREMGRLILKVLAQLQGAKLSDDWSPFQRSRSRYSITYRNGFIYYPLSFTSSTVINLDSITDEN